NYKYYKKMSIIIYYNILFRNVLSESKYNDLSKISGLISAHEKFEGKKIKHINFDVNSHYGNIYNLKESNHLYFMCSVINGVNIIKTYSDFLIFRAISKYMCID